MPKMIGSINCYVNCWAKCGKKTFYYDGTTKGLVNSALSAGLKIGDKIKTEFGKEETLIAAPHDDRCGGVWAR